MSRAPRALVAGGHPATVEAAAELLSAGGNAYDAVVGAGFAACVAEPGLTSLGGGGFLLARTAGGDELLLDFFVDTPGRGHPGGVEPHLTPVTIRFRGADQVFHAGHGAVATPGCLAGYLHAHRRLGRLPLREVLAPAVRLARGGVVINPQQGEIFELLTAIFSLTPHGRQLFCPAGAPLGVGDAFRNPDYADFLEQLADGRITGFADPTVAHPLLEAMAGHGGLLTRDDLDAYQVTERTPLALDVAGCRVLTNPPPSFGGTLITRALARTAGHVPHTGAGGAEALVDALVAVTDEHVGAAPRSTQGTTHISVADAEGNLAAMTTSNGSCSGVIVPGTGVQLNNIMGEEDLHPGGFHAAPPGLRVGSMMAPSVVTRRDGSRVVLGSGGSERIRSALTLVIGQLAGAGSLEDAVEHPRLHWDGTTLQIEPGWPDEVLDRLRARWTVNEWPERNLFFGGVHAVATDGAAVGDPRRGGSTAAVTVTS